METNLSPSSKLIDLEDTRAENSPRECPAHAWGLNSLEVNAKITEWMKIAGCVTLVWRRSSAEPSNIRSVILKPKISFDLLKNSLDSAMLSYNSLPIPGFCDPWPGKTNAFILFLYIC